MEPTITSNETTDVDVSPEESLTTRPVAADGSHVDLEAEVVFDMDDVSVLYGDFRAVRGATMKIRKHQITAFIGPSGCGKTTVLRCLNRMNDFITTAKVEGTINYHGVNLYDPRSMPPRSAAASAWCSRSRIRSRSRSTTTSPTARGSPVCASAPNSTRWWRSHFAAQRCGTR